MRRGGTVSATASHAEFAGPDSVLGFSKARSEPADSVVRFYELRNDLRLLNGALKLDSRLIPARRTDSRGELVLRELQS